MYHSRVRKAFPPFFAALSVFSAAERLIFLPVGDRYSNRDVRIESLLDTKSYDPKYTFIGFGFGNAFDAEVTFLTERPGLGDEGLVDLSYNYLPAIPDLGLGISVGIQDVMNHGAGRSLYVAISIRANNYEDYNADTPSELTIGAGTGRYKGLFAGARLPVTNGIRFLVEYDSERMTAGLELQPLRGVLVRWIARDRETLVGATFTKRF